MTESDHDSFRKDELTGHWVAVAPGRRGAWKAVKPRSNTSHSTAATSPAHQLVVPDADRVVLPPAEEGHGAFAVRCHGCVELFPRDHDHRMPASAAAHKTVRRRALSSAA